MDFHFNVVKLLERDVIRAGNGIAAGVLLGSIQRGRRLTLTIEHYEALTPERGAPDSPLGNQQSLEPFLNRWRGNDRTLSVIGLYRSRPREEATATRSQSSNGNGGRNPGRNGVTPIKERTAAQSPWDASTADLRGLELSGEAAVLSADGSQKTEQVLLLVRAKNDEGLEGVLYLARAGKGLWQSRPTLLRRGDLSQVEAEEQDSEASGIFSEEQNAAPYQKRPFAPGRGSSVPGNHVWPIILLVVAAALTAGFLELRGQQGRALLAHAAQVTGDTGLGLKVERAGSDWQLTWNKNAPILNSAIRGKLFITDGAIQKDLELNPEELREGAIIYTPVTDNAVLQLQVNTANSTEPVSESVRIVSGLLPSLFSDKFPGPASSPIIPPASANPASANRPRSDAAAPGNTGAETTAKAAEAVRGGAAEKSAKEGAAEMPAAEQKAAPSPSSESLAVKSQPAMAPGFPVISTEATSPATATQPKPGISVFQPAQLLSSTEPVYPSNARDAGISGSVEVQFTIAANGEVNHVKVTKGNPLLGEAAAEAVRQRHYKPAKLDGVPTDTNASVVFAFKAN